ncbi:unnamed protein product [Triticum turgidum subsp. durum]|uniref:Chlorophyll a-b binding protein, chloroplastic n=1 Tax=Triticum turgidum subsp. durum TaxID=4567 RepID=A0A9R0SF07_TRITD|nr:unnamed protein product [Triticum turgidum subsp. durum]
MAALAPTKMLGTRLNFAGSSRYATAAPTAGAQKIVSLFDRFKKKPAPKPKPAPVATSSVGIDDELAKWYGPDRRIYLPNGLLDRSEVPEYLNGEVPGDYGYDPFGLGKKPEDFAKYQAFELIHASNLILAVVAEVVLVGGAEYYRITNGLEFDDKLHPGGPFDPLGLATDPDQAALLKVKEIKNGRLAMFSMLGFFIQAYVTGEGPFENLCAHLSDPFGNNLLTVISGAAERVPSL